MARSSSAYGVGSPLQNIFPSPVASSRAPTGSDLNYEVGQLWVDTSTNNSYVLTSYSGGSAVWSQATSAGSDVDTLTGDSGGAISPTSSNINIVGGDGLTVAGSGSTLTINRDAEGGYPITPYVVGTSGIAGYTTVQAGIDAANADGGGLVFVQPGTYTEDLTLYDAVVLWCDVGTATISGSATPPDSGTVRIDGFNLSHASAIISSAAAGTTDLYLVNCFMSVTSGYVFDVDNWTGSIFLDNCGTGSTTDGVVNNSSGTSNIKFVNSEVGAGSGNAMAINASSGILRLDTCNVGCPITMGGSGTVVIQNGCKLAGALTIGGSLSGFIVNSYFSTGATAALNMSSSGDVAVTSCGIDSSNSPAIDGAGSGTLTLTGVEFEDNAETAATLTLASGTSLTGTSLATTFDTNVAAAGLTISATDIDADGTDADIPVTVTPKGTGVFTVDSGGVLVTAGDVINTHSSAGADVTMEVTNSDNTDGSSRAGLELATGGTSSGDPYVNFLLSGGQAFTMGIDNSSTNDDFVISDSSALGTDNRIVIDGSSGDVSVTGNLALPTAAKQLQVEGGAVTDFIGQATLSSGTVTVANTNIAASDRIICTRSDINGSTALGVLITGITASTSFTITAVQPGTPGSTETNDTSIVDYFIVREL